MQYVILLPAKSSKQSTGCLIRAVHVWACMCVYTALMDGSAAAGQMLWHILMAGLSRPAALFFFLRRRCWTEPSDRWVQPHASTSRSGCTCQHISLSVLLLGNHSKSKGCARCRKEKNIPRPRPPPLGCHGRGSWSSSSEP